MRDLTTKHQIFEFMRAIGREAKSNSRVYFTGGATSVLMDWRDSTVDIDIKFEPELDELYRAIPNIKEKLRVNIELAAPSDFIPEVPGWRDRSKYIGTEGKVDFYHYDLYSQALSKAERGHTQDVADIKAMIEAGMVNREKLMELFRRIKPEIYKYPAVDPDSFETATRQIANIDEDP